MRSIQRYTGMGNDGMIFCGPMYVPSDLLSARASWVELH